MPSFREHSAVRKWDKANRLTRDTIPPRRRGYRWNSSRGISGSNLDVMELREDAPIETQIQLRTCLVGMPYDEP